MRAGTALSHVVEFSVGAPDGELAWGLFDGAGLPLATGTVTPEPGAVSAAITVAAEDNEIPGAALIAYRELRWSYYVSDALQSGTLRYRLEAFLPLGVSEDGVRRKLGLEQHELSDSQIDLAAAYLQFQEAVSPAVLSPIEATSGNQAIAAKDAIEALAALELIPSLQVRVAAKESSGTSQYQRGAINWDALRSYLTGLVARGSELAIGVEVTAASSAALLFVVVRDDPVTNGTV